MYDICCNKKDQFPDFEYVSDFHMAVYSVSTTSQLVDKPRATYFIVAIQTLILKISFLGLLARFVHRVKCVKKPWKQSCDIWS